MAKTKKRKKQQNVPKPAVKEKPLLSRQAEIGLLLVILLLAFGVRMIRIDSPLLDFHAARQTQTASNAYYFATNTANFFQPKFIYTDKQGNAPGVTEMELPVYQYILGMTYRVTGVHDFMGRLLSIFFGLGVTAYVWIIARRYFGIIAAGTAALLYAITPVAVFFNRTYQPDTMASFFFIGGIYHLAVWLDDRESRHLKISAPMIALCLLIKPMVVVMLVPWIVYEFISRRFWEKAARSDLWRVGAAAAFALGTTGVWYFYTHFFIRNVTGLTMSRQQFKTTEFWFSPWFYFQTLERVWIVLTPIGAIMLALAFFLMWRDRRARIFSTLVVGHFLYFIVMAEYTYPHFYYQLPFVPIAAVCIGWLSARIIKWAGDDDSSLLIAQVVLVSAFIGIGIFSYTSSTRWYYIDHAPLVLNAAEKTLEIAGPDAMVLSNDMAANDFHYYSRSTMPASSRVSPSVQYVVWLKYAEWDVVKSLPEDSQLIVNEQTYAIWKLESNNN